MMKKLLTHTKPSAMYKVAIIATLLQTMVSNSTFCMQSNTNTNTFRNLMDRMVSATPGVLSRAVKKAEDNPKTSAAIVAAGLLYGIYKISHVRAQIKLLDIQPKQPEAEPTESALSSALLFFSDPSTWWAKKRNRFVKSVLVDEEQELQNIAAENAMSHQKDLDVTLAANDYRQLEQKIAENRSRLSRLLFGPWQQYPAINVMLPNGNRPLHRYIETIPGRSHIDYTMLTTILQFNPDLNLKNTDKYTPVHLAIKQLTHETVNKDKAIQLFNIATILARKTRNYSLTSADADFKYKNNKGEICILKKSILHTTADIDDDATRSAIFTILMQHGSMDSPDATGAYETTPLLYAARHNRKEMVEQLINRKHLSDIVLNTSSCNKNYLLHHLVTHNMINQIVRVLNDKKTKISEGHWDNAVKACIENKNDQLFRLIMDAISSDQIKINVVKNNAAALFNNYLMTTSIRYICDNATLRNAITEEQWSNAITTCLKNSSGNLFEIIMNAIPGNMKANVIQNNRFLEQGWVKNNNIAIEKILSHIVASKKGNHVNTIPNDAINTISTHLIKIATSNTNSTIKDLATECCRLYKIVLPEKKSYLEKFIDRLSAHDKEESYINSDAFNVLQ